MKNKTAKISVIVAVYNIENYVSECIESIINQTYTNIEIILIDDGSTDKSGKICDKYKVKDKRVIVIHQNNKGLSEARNEGIKISTGDYVAFVDGDDVISPIMYETMIQYVIDKDTDIVVCRPTSKLCDLATQINSNIEIKKLTGKDSIKYLFNDYVCGNYAWNKLYFSKLFKDIKYPKNKYFEDIYVTYKLFNMSNNITFLNEKLIYHRERENQITCGENVKFEIIKDHIGAYIQLYEDNNMKPFIKDVSKNMLACLKRCKRLTLQNKIIGANKKESINYINKIIRKYCNNDNLSQTDYVQSRILLKCNHLAVLYWLSSAKKIIYKKNKIKKITNC